MAVRSKKDDHIMDAAAKDGPEQYPEKSRPPSVLRGQNRSDERTRAGNCREMMSEYNPLVGRDVILAVIAGDRRRDVPVVKHQNFCGDECGIITISQGKHT